MKQALVTSILLLSGLISFAQGKEDIKPWDENPFIEYKRNYIGAYVGIFEWNLNYERNIFQRPRSYTNLRFGFGLWKDEPTKYGYGGNYLNASLVHLIGKRTAHFELILGIKYFITGRDEVMNTFGYPYLPDLYFGYRHEKPDGKLVLRFGINIPTLVNLGIGYKF
ncbi:MAG: hypothetical protein NTW82_09615 [Bacteroidia bacterium]|nr:hypothetical protein [Bacteroidia bacterium]